MYSVSPVDGKVRWNAAPPALPCLNSSRGAGAVALARCCVHHVARVLLPAEQERRGARLQRLAAAEALRSATYASAAGDGQICGPFTRPGCYCARYGRVVEAGEWSGWAGPARRRLICRLLPSSAALSQAAAVRHILFCSRSAT